jgi:hypothetical protein
VDHRGLTRNLEGPPESRIGDLQRYSNWAADCTIVASMVVFGTSSRSGAADDEPECIGNRSAPANKQPAAVGPGLPYRYRCDMSRLDRIVSDPAVVTANRRFVVCDIPSRTYLSSCHRA